MITCVHVCVYMGVCALEGGGGGGEAIRGICHYLKDTIEGALFPNLNLVYTYT